MGKKAKFKKIRRVASQLPLIKINTCIGQILDGTDLIDQGVEKVEGVDVVSSVLYRKKTIQAQPLNHNRKMKAMYNKYGMAGVAYYINAVKSFVNKKENAI